MKKCIVTIVISMFSTSVFCQDLEIKKVKKTIIEFFESFHKQDTIKLKEMTMGNINMQSISVTEEGKIRLNENDYNDFLRNIAGIPKNKKFEEKLLDFDIKIDGSMANAWTPYEFWFDNNFSHCGVNSFQLIKVDEDWKIIYLVDTRRQKDCKPNN